MKLHAVVEIVAGREGDPGIHILTTKAEADAVVAQLKEENNAAIDDDDCFIVEQEVEVAALTERQIKALDWMLTVLIEQTEEWSPAGQPDQVVEQVCDIASVVELLPAGELRDRLDALLAKEAAEPREPLKYEAVVPVTSEMIFHQLISAFEGGSTYWAQSADLISPQDESIPNPKNLVWWGRTKTLYEGEFEIHLTEDEESTEGAGRVHKLTPETVQRGIQVMSSKYPHHFTAMIEENGDATTGDVFLQCCLFGDIIYG